MQWTRGPIAAVGGAIMCLGVLATEASAEWVELGCKDVALSRDRDTLRVSRREGRFTAIRLSARGNDVEMLRLTVVYGNGSPDDIDVRHFIRRGERTRPLDLTGRDRVVDKTEMHYRQGRHAPGRAEICVEGLAAETHA